MMIMKMVRLLFSKTTVPGYLESKTTLPYHPECW